MNYFQVFSTLGYFLLIGHEKNVEGRGPLQFLQGLKLENIGSVNNIQGLVKKTKLAEPVEGGVHNVHELVRKTPEEGVSNVQGLVKKNNTPDESTKNLKGSPTTAPAKKAAPLDDGLHNVHELVKKTPIEGSVTNVKELVKKTPVDEGLSNVQGLVKKNPVDDGLTSVQGVVQNPPAVESGMSNVQELVQKNSKVEGAKNIQDLVKDTPIEESVNNVQEFVKKTGLEDNLDKVVNDTKLRDNTGQVMNNLPIEGVVKETPLRELPLDQIKQSPKGKNQGQAPTTTTAKPGVPTVTITSKTKMITPKEVGPPSLATITTVTPKTIVVTTHSPTTAEVKTTTPATATTEGPKSTGGAILNLEVNSPK